MTHRVLVLGGAGYIGGKVVDELLALNCCVTVLDSLIYNNEYLKFHPNLKFIYGDVRHLGIIFGDEINNFDSIINLACVVGDGAAATFPEQAKEIELGTLKYLKDNYGGMLVWPSSCSCYGASKDPNEILTEESEVNPLSLYAENKCNGEKILHKRPKTIIYRLATVHGLGDISTRFIKTDLVVNTLTIKSLTSKVMNVCGGAQWRPNIAVSTVAKIFTESATKHFYHSFNGNVFNLSEENYTILDIANMIKSVNNDSYINLTLSSFEDSRNYRVSNEKAKKILGLTFQNHVFDSINKISQIVKSGIIKNLELSNYSNVAHLQLLKKQGVTI